MQVDFLDAHNRHLIDANALFSRHRYANADQLYGLAAECGIKQLMVGLGMPVDPVTGGPQNGNDKKHVDAIWTRYENFLSGKTAGANYGLPALNPFKNWSISDRYANQSHFTEAMVEAHRNGASQVSDLLKKAKLDGLLK